MTAAWAPVRAVSGRSIRCPRGPVPAGPWRNGLIACDAGPQRRLGLPNEERPHKMGAPELSRRRERSVSRPLSMSRAAAVGVAAVALIASVGVAAASPGSASGQTRLAAKGSSTPLPSLGWALPAAPVGRQLGWLVGAVRRPPIPAAVFRAHFDAAFLEHVSPRTFNAALAGLHVGGAWRIVTLDATTSPGELAVSVLAGSTRFGVEISVDAKGLIDGLLVQPVPRCRPRRGPGRHSTRSCPRSRLTLVSRRPRCRQEDPARPFTCCRPRRHDRSGPCSRSSCSGRSLGRSGREPSPGTSRWHSRRT